MDLEDILGSYDPAEVSGGMKYISHPNGWPKFELLVEATRCQLAIDNYVRNLDNYMLESGTELNLVSEPVHNPIELTPIIDSIPEVSVSRS